MKKIMLTASAVLLWSGCLHAQDTITMPVEDYKAILQQLQTLQKRVDVLEHDKTSGKGDDKNIAKLEKDVDNIYNTLDQVESKSLQDMVNFGAELRTRVDNFKVKNHRYLSDNSIQNTSNDNSWSNRFRINMDAKIQKNLLFTGRLSVYKNFADSDTSSMAGDSNNAHLTGDNTVKLDRAYIDWIPEGMPVPLAITFGRHPSSEGPPFEMKENRKRQSTYPGLLFDGEADGVVATVGLERYTGWKNSGLRLAYGKAYQDDDNVESYLNNASSYSDTNVFAAFLETEIPGVKDSLIVLSALKATSMYADTTPLMGGAAEQANLGDMELYGIHAQANNVAGSNFDIFLSTGLNKANPNGQTVNGMGLLSNDGITDHAGWAAYAGLRYNIQSARFNNPKVGFEFNHGSDYWFSFTSGSTELYNKLAVRGDVYDVYYIQPFNDNLFMRLGYTMADYNYGMSGFHIGDAGDSTETLRNGYLLLDARF
ncbi:MAG: DUF3373 domain-containing protein [Desulfobulbaceae bacterium]|nr:DUF3373 domain-containing protein [Desulfobulbaceae bacterium]